MGRHRRLDPADPQLTAPDFPHGENRGYERGCSCQPCRIAHRDAQRAAYARRRDAEPARSTDRLPAGPTREHLTKLLDAVDGNLHLVGRAAGLHPGSIQSVLNAKKYVSRATADALAALTVADLDSARLLTPPDRARAHLTKLLEHEDCTIYAIAAAIGLRPRRIAEIMRNHGTYLTIDTERYILQLTPRTVQRNAAHVNPRRTRTIIRSLQANGWPTTMLMKMVTVNERRSCWPWLHEDYDRLISQDTVRRVEELAKRLGDRQGPSSRARLLARRLGYYPPIHYDSDMQLIRESIRSKDHEADVELTRYRCWLRAAGLTAEGYSTPEVSDMLQVSTQTVNRVRRAIGIRWTLDSAAIREHRVLPGQDALLGEISRYLRGIHLRERTDVSDQPDIIYSQRWTDMLAGIAALNETSELVAA